MASVPSAAKLNCAMGVGRNFSIPTFVMPVAIVWGGAFTIMNLELSSTTMVLCISLLTFLTASDSQMVRDCCRRAKLESCCSVTALQKQVQVALTAFACKSNPTNLAVGVMHVHYDFTAEIHELFGFTAKQMADSLSQNGYRL